MHARDNLNGTTTLNQQDFETPSHFTNAEIVKTMPVKHNKVFRQNMPQLQHHIVTIHSYNNRKNNQPIPFGNYNQTNQIVITTNQIKITINQKKTISL